MIIMLLMSILPIMVTMMLMIINIYISIKTLKDREKPSPYECGFTPLTPPHLPFSIQFFLISLIFLIFDIEIILLIPLIPTISLKMEVYFWMSTLLIIYLCLILGLIYEWNEQSIIWIK